MDSTDVKFDLDELEKKMTAKQKKFADEFIKSGNATQAAIQAEYSKKTARQSGSENLSKPYIKQYIQAKMQKIEDGKIMDAKEALQIVAKIARGEAVTKGWMQQGKELVEVEVKPSTKEILAASKEILKRYPISELEKAQIKQAQAQAIKAQAEAEVAKTQVESLNRTADSAVKRLSKLSTEDLRKIAKLGDDDD